MQHLQAASVAIATLLAAQGAGAAPFSDCRALSGQRIAPVVELYTSEGCSSCPPADQWLSGLERNGPAVLQAFHVGYWDYIGWVDRFAQPAHTVRQRQLARWNQQASIYTPQVVLDGADWRAWPRSPKAPPQGSSADARFALSLRRVGEDQFEGQVQALSGAAPQWAAYWTVTEDGHRSRVQAGENAGETLRHDHVVRQYTEAGSHASAPGQPQRLTLRTIGATPLHPRRINLVVFDPRNGRTLQALSLACTG